MRSPLWKRKPASAGFTLIELMVTIAIAAILGTIAVSSYTSNVRKSRRTEARTALLDLAGREERFFSTNSTYTNLNTNLGYTNAFPQTVGGGYYTVSICVSNNAAPPCTGAAASGSMFVITATPTGTQAKDTACASFTVDNWGQQGGTSASCWN